MIKKILIVDATRHERSPVFNTLKALGYDCSFLNYRQGFVYNNRIMRALLRRVGFFRFLKNRTTQNTNKKLLKLTKDLRPNLVLILEGENILPETILQIKKQGAITANWFIDFMTHWHIIESIAPNYDYFFTSDKCVLEKLNELGFKNCFYLPFAVENIFKETPLKNRKNVYNISLVASYDSNRWTKREELLSVV